MGSKRERHRRKLRRRNLTAYRHEARRWRRIAQALGLATAALGLAGGLLLGERYLTRYTAGSSAQPAPAPRPTVNVRSPEAKAFAYLVDTHPMRELRDSLMKRIEEKSLRLLFYDGDVSGPVYIGAAFFTERQTNGTYRPGLVLNRRWLLNQRIGEDAKRCGIWHEVFHLGQAEREPENAWVFEATADAALTEQRVRLLFRYEVEAFDATCDLEQQLEVPARDRNIMCVARDRGGRRGLASTLAETLAHLEGHHRFRDLMRELAAAY